MYVRMLFLMIKCIVVRQMKEKKKKNIKSMKKKINKKLLVTLEVEELIRKRNSEKKN